MKLIAALQTIKDAGYSHITLCNGGECVFLSSEDNSKPTIYGVDITDEKLKTAVYWVEENIPLGDGVMEL